MVTEDKNPQGNPTSTTHNEEQPHEEVDKNTQASSAHQDYSQMTLEQLAKALSHLIKSNDIAANTTEIAKVREAFRNAFNTESEKKKKAYLAEGGEEEGFDYRPAVKKEFDELVAQFKAQQEAHHEKQKSEQSTNIKERQEIIERLKNLYTNAAPETNLFQEIRKIKEDWRNAGFIPRIQFKRMQQDYYFHLDQFYEMLDLNKEYREQEYEHNLEKRYQIIERVKELIKEPIIRQALNELQFLHRLWKDEAVPVAEEFREKTWQEFKELSSKVLERKTELYEKLEKEYDHNLEQKNKIIAAITKLANPEKEANHRYWQKSIKEVENLRKEFIGLGKVPKGEASQNWNHFKEALRSFNTAKNNFYRARKHEQHENMQKKLNLIEIAKQNQDSEDWDAALPLFKDIQQQWKNIGYIPRKKSNELWEEFQNACNHFFDNYRSKTGNNKDDWQHNFEEKKELIDQLKNIKKNSQAAEEINEIKNKWNALGKVPKNKKDINKNFEKVLEEKMLANNMSIFDLEDDHLSEQQLTDKARRIKKQIDNLDIEISNLENNLAFFNNPNRDNPLLKDTYANLDTKKEALENLKTALHQMIEEADKKASPSSDAEADETTEE